MAYDLKLALMCGTDIPIPSCQLIVHQPKLKEIALIGEDDFFVGTQTLCVNKNLIIQDKTLLSNTNNFQIFMTIMQEKETVDKKEAVKQLFPLILPKYQMVLTPRSIMLTNDKENLLIDETNFDVFQAVLSEIFCIKSSPMDAQTFNPQSQKAKEIADKLMRARQRVAAQKKETEGSILGRYISVLTVGLASMSLEECNNLTVFQLFDLVERYMLFVNWDMDVKSRLAGGKPEGKPDNWMKNIH